MPLCLLFATTSLSCGAEGTAAPYSQRPEQRCKTIGDSTASLLSLAEEGQVDGLVEVVDRLMTERNGTRIQQAVDMLLGLLQALPREEASSFEFQILLDLIEQAKEPLKAVVDHIATGPESRRAVFPVLSQAMLECPRDSLILTVADLFASTELLAALGAALDDPIVVGLLANIPDLPEDGRAGFVALIRLVINAVQAETFEFSDLRSLLGFLELDEPPLSQLFEELEAYLQGATFEHLLLTLECIESTEVDGEPGVDVLGSLVYDLITLEELDVAGLLTIAAPLLAQLQQADIQVLGTAALNVLIADVGLRVQAIDLIAFFLRSDNLGPVLSAVGAMLDAGALEDIVVLLSSLTLLCPDDPPAYGVAE